MALWFGVQKFRRSPTACCHYPRYLSETSKTLTDGQGGGEAASGGCHHQQLGDVRWSEVLPAIGWSKYYPQIIPNHWKSSTFCDTSRYSSIHQDQKLRTALRISLPMWFSHIQPLSPYILIHPVPTPIHPFSELWTLHLIRSRRGHDALQRVQWRSAAPKAAEVGSCFALTPGIEHTLREVIQSIQGFAGDLAIWVSP